MAIKNYSATSLIGGGSGALDSIDGATLQDLDSCIVFTADTFYFYILDADSAAAESSPDIITPDTSPGDKRWILVAKVSNWFDQAVKAASSPTFNGLTITSINKMAVTPPATSSTLAVADGKTLTCSNTLTLAGTDGASIDFGAGGTAAIIDAAQSLSNKTLVDAKVQTSINAQVGTTYTLVLTDVSKIVTLTNAGAITVTIPTNASVAFPIGSQIDFVQGGAGKVTFSGAGVTINSKESEKSIATQWVGVSLIKLDTDTWLLVGDLIA